MTGKELFDVLSSGGIASITKTPAGILIVRNSDEEAVIPEDGTVERVISKGREMELILRGETDSLYEELNACMNAKQPLGMKRILTGIMDALSGSLVPLLPMLMAAAMFKTGLLLFHGTGCVVDRPSAFRWYLRAAELGNISAMNDLAYCLINGFGIPANPEEGFAWALRAAEKGHSPSQVMVGECYMSGTGTKADGEKALLWLRRAAMQGNNRARMLLRDWPTDGSSTEPTR